ARDARCHRDGGGRQDRGAREGRSSEKMNRFLWILLATGSVFAHDTWIVPDRFAAKRGQPITLDMTSGMGFPALDYAIKPDRVGRAFARLGGRTTTLTPRAAAHS